MTDQEREFEKHLGVPENWSKTLIDLEYCLGWIHRENGLAEPAHANLHYMRGWNETKPNS